MIKYRRTTLKGGVKGVAMLPGNGVLIDENTYPFLVILTLK